MLNCITIDEKGNQTTVQVSLLVKTRKKCSMLLWTNQKDYSGFQHSILQPIAFPISWYSESHTIEALQQLDAHSISNIEVIPRQ